MVAPCPPAIPLPAHSHVLLAFLSQSALSLLSVLRCPPGAGAGAGASAGGGSGAAAVSSGAMEDVEAADLRDLLNVNRNATPKLLFGTIGGALGVVMTLAPSLYGFLQRLQSAMTSYVLADFSQIMDLVLLASR